ncbi:hypothetical protein [Desulfosporosinus sp. BICA1-9]|nr:hypothetical protein [Desulfosporosinus sp. BICA1-9]
MSLLRSFQPIVDEQSRVLILGSMPGVESNTKRYEEKLREWSIIGDINKN